MPLQFLKRNGSAIWRPAAAVLVLALCLGVAPSARAQGSRFTSDLSGNLLSKASGGLLAPQIQTQPQPQIVEPGRLASFSVFVVDSQGVTYQWRFNGNPIGGAVSDALILTNVSAANEGQYSVVVTNSAGSATSANAALYIDSDGDGMADSWEMTNFGNLNQTATGDFDNDGVSNLDEFRDGTNPNSNASYRPRLTIVSDGGGSVTVTPAKLSYDLGEVVTLTATANSPNTFQGWSGDLTGTTNPATITMSANRTVTARFVNATTPQGLVSWWRAEGNAQDVTGTNNGALINGATFAAGKVGQAFSLNGTNQSVEVPDSPSLRPKSVTLEAWVLFNSTSGNQTIFAKPVAGSLDSYVMWYNGNALNGAIADTCCFGTLVGVTFNPGVGTWHHVAFTFDDATRTEALYLDGALVSTANAGRSIAYDSSPMLLGRGNATGFFSGKIDEATIYNRALTSDEVASIYVADTAGKRLVQPNFTTPAQLPDAALATAYSQQLAATLGTAPYSYALTHDGLPPGLSLSAAGLISGTPTGAGTYFFGVTVTDAAGQSSEQTFSLKVFAPVNPPPGLVAWWRAQNNADDSIGTNNGTLRNGATFTAGKVGQGFSLDGVDDYVDVA
jgi:hypothetical protein